MKFYNNLALAACLLFTVNVQAAWLLDQDASDISFNSIKNGQIVESHEFKSMQGVVSDAGKVNITIELASVETLIPIRNERLAKLLFETFKFPSAAISADVPLEHIKRLKVGESSNISLKLKLSLHGKDQMLDADVLLVSIGGDAYQIVSRKPLVLSAAQFDLAAGLEALREIAKLKAITPQVPVSFNLIFRKVTKSNNIVL